MPEIIAAHLERVARELVDAQRVELWESQQAYEDAKVALAAALAACARERDEQLLKAAKAALAEMEDYERHLQLEVFGTKEALRDALRANA